MDTFESHDDEQVLNFARQINGVVPLNVGDRIYQRGEDRHDKPVKVILNNGTLSYIKEGKSSAGTGNPRDDHEVSFLVRIKTEFSDETLMNIMELGKAAVRLDKALFNVGDYDLKFGLDLVMFEQVLIMPSVLSDKTKLVHEIRTRLDLVTEYIGGLLTRFEDNYFAKGIDLKSVDMLFNVSNSGGVQGRRYTEAELQRKKESAGNDGINNPENYFFVDILVAQNFLKDITVLRRLSSEFSSYHNRLITVLEEIKQA